MPGKSCNTNLLKFVEVAMRVMAKGSNMDIVYLNFSKAFDLVPRKRLPSKLKAHGFGGPILNWIDMWLRDCKHRVVLKGKASSWTTFKSGVPQGTGTVVS